MLSEEKTHKKPYSKLCIRTLPGPSRAGHPRTVPVVVTANNLWIIERAHACLPVYRLPSRKNNS
jgi:hypothetical protein